MCAQIVISNRSKLLLVDTRHNSARNFAGILLPISTILPLTLFLISALSVNQQDGKVDDVKVGEDHAPSASITLDDLLGHGPRHRVLGYVDEIAGKPRRQGVRPRHDPVSKVVDMAGTAPPAGGEES